MCREWCNRWSCSVGERMQHIWPLCVLLETLTNRPVRVSDLDRQTSEGIRPWQTDQWGYRTLTNRPLRASDLDKQTGEGIRAWQTDWWGYRSLTNRPVRVSELDKQTSEGIRTWQTDQWGYQSSGPFSFSGVWAQNCDSFTMPIKMSPFSFIYVCRWTDNPTAHSDSGKKQILFLIVCFVVVRF